VSPARERLRVNDVRFLAVARSLSEDDWSRDSLCSSWTNHEVMAHLVIGCGVSTRTVALEIARHRGVFDPANANLAKRLAAQRTPSELIEDFAALIDRPHGLGRVFPRRLLLGDHVIHEFDIVLPLGMQPTVEATAIIAVLETQVRLPNPFVPAAARARGLCLHATDLDWSHRSGSGLISGSSAHLALALAGRSWALEHLTGDGVAMLRNRG
jgi:uncharacterized protein (TIGR03083 family)